MTKAVTLPAVMLDLSQRISDLPARGDDVHSWEGWELGRCAAIACGWYFEDVGRDDVQWFNERGGIEQSPLPLCTWEFAYKLIPAGEIAFELEMMFSKDECWPAIRIKWMERDETDPKKWRGIVVKGATPAACLTAAALELRAKYAMSEQAA
jgi:hypothetical protein